MSLPTPYYEDKASGITIYCANCREILPSLPKVDLVVTSPPYNQKLDQFVASGFKAEGASKWAKRAASAYFDSMDESEYQREQVEMLNACFNFCTSDRASMFYNHKCRWRDKVLIHPITIVQKSKWQIRQEIVWSRDGSLTQNARMFPPSEERIFWMHKGVWHWNEDANRWMSVWRMDSEKNTPHPLAFPIDIPIRAIQATTTEGDIVLDPYMGGGTSLIAAKESGRKAIGIEINEDYCRIAVERLRQEVLITV